MTDLSLVALKQTEFRNTFNLLLQQKQSKLMQAVKQDKFTGSESTAYLTQWGKARMKSPSADSAPIIQDDIQKTRRWISGIKRRLSTTIPTWEALQTEADIKSPVMEVFRAAAMVDFDTFIVKNFFSTSRTGVPGDYTDIAFDTANTVGIDVGGTGSNLNVAKIVAAKRLMTKNDWDMSEPAYMLIGAEQERALDQLVPSTSAELAAAYGVKRDDDGNLMKIKGINVIVMSDDVFDNLRNADAPGSGITTVPVWQPSGMQVGWWQDYTVKVNERVDLEGHPWQIYVMMMLNAARTEEKKVIQIRCFETA